jgi:dTDP-4-amino-4,6-dideoxygalactose transaminase
MCPFYPGTANVTDFEYRFADRFESSHAIAFPYGRVALFAFLKAMGINQKQVIMPAYTCSVVAHAVHLSGNTPIFVDNGANSFNMDLSQVPELINSETRVIIATNTFGYAQDVDELQQIIEDASSRFGHKIWLVQDCAHAFGASWNDELIGKSGDVAIYGLNFSKLCTSIFGGMITTSDHDVANHLRDWSELNIKASTWRKSLRRYLYLISATTALHPTLFEFTWLLKTKTSLLERWTHSFHLDNKIRFPSDALESLSRLESRVGINNLENYSHRIEQRRQIAQLYDEELHVPQTWTKPPLQMGATYSHYSILVPNRYEVLQNWARQGVELGTVIDYVIPSLPEYKASHYGLWPNATKIAQSVINLPFKKPDIVLETAKTLCASYHD